MSVLSLTLALALQAPGGSWGDDFDPDDRVSDSSDAKDTSDSGSSGTSFSTPSNQAAGRAYKRRKSGAELPILDWQEERKLESVMRQSLVKVYLDMLGEPHDYRVRFKSDIPSDVKDWAYQRDDVKARLAGMRASVDKQLKTRMGMPEVALQRMIALKQDFRPEHLRPLMHRLPRITDAVVTVDRVQPLGEKMYRLDYVVEMRLAGFTRSTRFQAVDVMYDGKQVRMPMRVLLDVSLRNEIDIFGNASPITISSPDSQGAQGLFASLISGQFIVDLFGGL